MSDNLKDLARRYADDIIVEHYPRSIGLFTIPEYPELESEPGMWSSALDAILTTLRYLAPATLLTLFWGNQSIFFTLLRHIDNAFRSIVFSSEEQKQAVIQWLSEAGPVQIEHLDTVWRHGWILCSVLDGSLPGACAGHPPTRLSIKHAQTIADHYLGVEAVFSRQELETIDSLSRHQEWKLATYLERVREALSKITPPVSKPTSQRTSPETTQFTLDYVAKGSGLTASQVHHKMSFKIYPTAQQALDPGEITILIRGPKDTYGMTVLPPILGKAQKIRQKVLGLQSKQTFTENALPITQGATYLRSYGKNHMNKTYFIPKTVYDIEIESEQREDHTKVSYTVHLEGKYEVSLTSRGQNIVGSPFIVKASHNIIHILEKENYCLEDGEEIDIVDIKTDRKVVLRIVDFVTEKMLLRENGALEKISEDEAKLLMQTDAENERSASVTKITDQVYSKETEIKTGKFYRIAMKVIRIHRVCKIFEQIRDDKKENKQTLSCVRNNQGIPDVVNSTLCDGYSSSYMLTDKRDKYIVPESISVSIKTEKAKTLYEDHTIVPVTKIENQMKKVHENYSTSCTPDSLDKIPEEIIEDDNISVDSMTTHSTSNPFLVDADFKDEKTLGTFVKTEFERNNSQNEETRQSSIAIVVDTNTPPSSITNPFFDTDVRHLERPKTPVYKIITGEISNRIDSPYLDPKNELISEEMLNNEFVNPFFVHQLQSSQNFEQPPMTDFIIGAPVSLPPMVRIPSPEPKMESFISANETRENFEAKRPDDEAENIFPLVFSTPVHSKKTNDFTAASSTFHSFDSNLTDTIDNSNESTASDNQMEPYRIELSPANRDLSPRKDIWDSAYVSIDDNTSSPDNNNNENATAPDSNTKQKLTSEEEYNKELSKMGPAERELWQTCVELNDSNKVQEEIKPYKWETKRPTFTPIIEESDRSISSGMRETSFKHNETDLVSVAFAELNDVYEEYFPNSENSSTTALEENTAVDNLSQTDEPGVESASEISADVTRHELEQEGKISEVQPNVTESVSVSHALQSPSSEPNKFSRKNKVQTQFGDKTCNIVLEKKKYWDERIRQNEANSEETTKHHKTKRRNSAKQLKNDSLSKRKGKEIVKKFLNTGNEQKSQITRQVSITKPEMVSKYSVSDTTEGNHNEKIVEKWKRFWDEKLEIEQEEHELELRSKSPRCSSKSPQRDCTKVTMNNNNSQNKLKSSVPAKQELPEEIFKAFETSPKRFFGTSRKQILNKIDTFIGKPSHPISSSQTDLNEASPDSGLVSSRISMFHKISNTEPLPWMQRKSQSMQNIHQRKDSEKSNTSTETKLQETKEHTTDKKPPKINKDVSSEVAVENVAIKDKRARISQESFNKSFDETDSMKTDKHVDYIEKTVDKAPKALNKPTHIDKYKKSNVLRRTSISRSEMDIFNKIPVEIDDRLDKHKSCDDLPKINVKSFISLYESVSKTSENQKQIKGIYKPHSKESQSHLQLNSVNIGAEKKKDKSRQSGFAKRRMEDKPISQKNKLQICPKSISIESVELSTDNETLDSKPINSDMKKTTYVSLSDIELEIIESSQDMSKESTPERTGQPHIDYKNRFKKAKQFFQSLEELREDKKPRQLNECEILLNQSTESLTEKPQKKLKKKKKSHSMPSSEIAKYWNQMQEQAAPKEAKLVKISEKFHVEDLFSDVMEGRLSRQGSLRGIPHKKAVLEAFRSMENISDGKISPYEMATSQIDFSTESQGKRAQSYLSEYPYLPTTDPSKYHSRLDVKASGLITLKELLERKGRRNSVPDLRLDTKFSEDL